MLPAPMLIIGAGFVGACMGAGPTLRKPSLELGRGARPPLLEWGAEAAAPLRTLGVIPQVPSEEKSCSQGVGGDSHGQ